MKGRFNYQWAGVLLVGGVVAYFLYKRWKDAQRAAAHPITVQPDSRLLRPMPVDPNLVTDAKIVA